ncbi:MAG: transglycosylase SLT domain-containing protein [Candidatus Vogelbacteria bacterium]|nr:transglycosylase SLT domain-containing protein [Candidatus Vogelbacteria bacterium]
MTIKVIALAPTEADILVFDNAPEPTAPELIELKSREYGINSRLALAIARCESRFRQYDKKTGEVLRGERNRHDVGVFQINEQYHLEKSRELGFDIYTAAGNVEYAIWLMSAYGRAPWVWSRECWSRAV